MNKNLHYNETPLDDDEQELQTLISNGTIKKPKNKSITLRLNDSDLTAIKIKATIQGIPYQTLISSILHQYLNGSLK